MLTILLELVAIAAALVWVVALALRGTGRLGPRRAAWSAARTDVEQKGEDGNVSAEVRPDRYPATPTDPEVPRPGGARRWVVAA